MIVEEWIVVRWEFKVVFDVVLVMGDVFVDIVFKVKI